MTWRDGFYSHSDDADEVSVYLPDDAEYINELHDDSDRRGWDPWRGWHDAADPISQSDLGRTTASSHDPASSSERRTLSQSIESTGVWNDPASVISATTAVSAETPALPPPAVPASILQTRLPVFTDREWSDRWRPNLPIWRPPSEHPRCQSTTPGWIPQVGEILLPYRLFGEIVWFASNRGQMGVGQVMSTYVVGGQLDEDPMGRAEVVEVLAVSGTADILPLVCWRPMWVNWIPDTPYPTWVVRWLC